METQFRSKQKTEKFQLVKRVLIIVGAALLTIILALLIVLATIMKGPSISARNTFVSTVLESGNLKFLAKIFLTPEEIQEIVDSASMGNISTDIDSELIDTSIEKEGNFDENGIEVSTVSGRGFFATMMVIKDPSKVHVGSTYPWQEYGKELDKIVKDSNAIAGVNGGLYAADGNKGGSPYGVCVSRGEIQFNKPQNWAGLYLIGLDNNDILKIEKIAGWTPEKLEQYIKDEGIRDAVAFQDEASDVNNHFVPLVINGEARELKGAGSGSNPRTAIGQRKDGAILLLVTDGRGASGHLGATASDLINIMLEYGAVNAANLDGGSSSCMYYKDEYLMTSVTLYYANSSWRLPTAFVVEGN